MEAYSNACVVDPLFFFSAMGRNGYCVTVLTLEAFLDWNYIKNKNVIKTTKQSKKNKINPLHAPVERVGTTKIKDTTVSAEDMYILYKQYLW